MNNKSIIQISNITSSLLNDFVAWTLINAQKKNISKLYFLARDGFVLKLIAEELIEKWGLNIECKYFYCSRYSLRIPTFHLIGDEAFNLLLTGSFHMTLDSILSRIEMPENTKNDVYEELHINKSFVKKELTKWDKTILFPKIRKSKILIDYMNEISIKNYKLTIDYMKQEGVFDNENFAIVDSGWTGSVQRNFRQLIESVSKDISITGFYYGLYKSNLPKKDGEYNSFLFKENSNILTKAKFCNNLIEIVSSSHKGMTLRYKYENNLVVPVFDKEPEFNTSDLNKIHKSVKDNAKIYAIKHNINSINEKKLVKTAKKNCKTIMYKPSFEQASAFKSYEFCDDVVMTYSSNIIEKLTQDEWSKYLLLNRIKNKLLKSNNKKIKLLFWPYGSLSVSDIKFKVFYRLNIYIYELLRDFYAKIKL